MHKTRFGSAELNCIALADTTANRTMMIDNPTAAGATSTDESSGHIGH